jgi:hypothetical protein
LALLQLLSTLRSIIQALLQLLTADHGINLLFLQLLSVGHSIAPTLLQLLSASREISVTLLQLLSTGGSILVALLQLLSQLSNVFGLDVAFLRLDELSLKFGFLRLAVVAFLDFLVNICLCGFQLVFVFYTRLDLLLQVSR